MTMPEKNVRHKKKMGKTKHVVSVLMLCLSLFSFPKPAHALSISPVLMITILLAVSTGGLCELLYGHQTPDDTACVDAVGHWSAHAAAYLKAKQEGQHAQMAADAMKLYHQQITDAQGAAGAYVASDLSITCATTLSLQAEMVMKSFVKAFTSVAQSMVATRDTGPNATSFSNAAKKERLCEVAEYICNGSGLNMQDTVKDCKSQDPFYGTPCQKNSKGGTYANADFNPDSLLVPKQLVLPANMKRGVDGHILIQTNNDSDLRFKAAWELCENAALSVSTPAHIASGGISSIEYESAMADARQQQLFGPGSSSDCFELLARRVACPNPANGGPNFSSGNSIDKVATTGLILTCYDAQKAACHRMKDPPPNGYGLDSQEDAEANAAMKGCDQNGLSLEMYMHIKHTRCIGMNTFITKVMPAQYHGDELHTKSAIDKCQDEATSYDDEVTKTEKAFKQQLTQTGTIRGLGGGGAAKSSMPVSGP